MVTFAIGGPWYGTRIDARLAFTLMTVAASSSSYGATPMRAIYEDGLLDVSRNRLMTKAFRAGVDWFVSIDADISARDDEQFTRALANALQQFHRDDVALVGAPCKTGAGVWNVVLDERAPPKDPTRRIDWRKEVAPRDVHRLGFGVVAFRLAWYAEHWPRAGVWFAPFFQTLVTPDANAPHGFGGYGEDYGHCNAVRDLGGRVICDPRLDVRHHVSRPGSPGERDE